MLVFVQDGCGACHEYMRRFDRVAPPYHQNGRGIPIQVGDLASEAAAMRLAERFDIEATPTTIGITRTGTTIKLVGAVETKHIRQMFENVSR